MRFFTQYDRPGVDECPLEEHPDEGLVETAGYIPTDVMVQRLIMAGERLVAFREAEYGPDDEIPDDAPANRMLNPLDAELEAKALRGRIAERARVASVKVDEPSSPSPAPLEASKDGAN